MASRIEKGALTNWWWTIDLWLIAGFGILFVAGIVIDMAASPPVAARLGLPTFHFVNRQIGYLAVTVVVAFLVSLASPRAVRRTALLLYVISMALVCATLVYGAEVKGARRWISIAGIGIQPSEFAKPAFVILSAWLFSEAAQRKGMPAAIFGLALLPATLIPLILQPDIGQTMLISVVWATVFFIAGLHIFWVAGLGGLGAAGVTLAYFFVPHVTARVDRFLNKGAGDTFQVDTAMDSFLSGGWLGRGPGEGIVKRILPDAHADFPFAVAGEEFGILACIALVLLFMLIVMRALYAAHRAEDPFCRLACAGLIALFGVQSVINMAVNVQLIPAKGMTLPFVSYGGSSLISLGVALGFLVAVTRRRPRAEMSDLWKGPMPRVASAA
ncbi:MAG: cell division protein FtsW [Hyphomicrobiales bacterium]|nr:cell division protein FtsW [Hyphomicrobiales bacterium]